MTVVLYDIPSSLPSNAWSPNPWKARAVLNYKRIPYRTEWVEFVDIEAHSKKLGITATSQRKDGSPLYTLPAIHDPSTGVYIADSFAIAEYLEKTYPHTPSVFPDNTIALQKVFEPILMQNISPVFRFIIPVVYLKLNPASQGYFRRTREISFGKKLEDIAPTGDDRTEAWGNLKKGLDTIHSYLISTDNKGPYMLGDKISWSDLVLFSFIYWWRLIWGEDSQEWKDVASWNDGRWEAHINALKEYHTVV
jgi:glutathione S-transferase